jgi:hypothetical protein
VSLINTPCYSTVKVFSLLLNPNTDSILSFISNLIAAVFLLLNLNTVMSIIFNVPAALASTVLRPSTFCPLAHYYMSTQIAASRAVRRLTTFATRGEVLYVFLPLTNSLSVVHFHVSSSITLVLTPSEVTQLPSPPLPSSSVPLRLPLGSRYLWRGT